MKNSLDHPTPDVRCDVAQRPRALPLVSAAATLALLVAGSTPAFAQLPDKKPGGPASKADRQSDHANRCARYGEGFVPVEGSDACVRIGGRLRIDFGGSPRSALSPMNGYANSGPIHADDDGVDRAYIRVPAKGVDGDPIVR
jgi:hypothetical protein